MGVTGFTLEVQGDSITSACEDMTVETVIGDVQLAIGKPFRKGRVRPVENLGEGGVPVEEFPRLFGPETQAIGCSLLIELGTGDGVRLKVSARGKPALFVQKTVNFLRFGHRHPSYLRVALPGGAKRTPTESV